MLNCPLCKQNTAYVSSTYPNVVVCRCTGSLLEVGSIENKVFKPLSQKSQENSNFVLYRLDKDDEIKSFGILFNNALRDDYHRKYFTQRAIFYIAKYNNDENNERSMMFFVDKISKIAQIFHLKEYKRPNNNDVEAVQKMLIDRNLAVKDDIPF